MKKALTLLLAMVMALSLVLTGCGGGTSSTAGGSTGSTGGSAPAGSTGDEPVSISIWVLEDKTDSFNYAKDLFVAENPNVSIEIVSAAIDVHKQNLKVSASSQTLPTMWFNWGGNLGSFYTLNGLTYDLSGYAAENNWGDKFQQAAMDLCTFDGQLAGYPLSMNMLGMFYRKDIFEANNIEVPTTFEEFEQVCADLKAAGITPISTGGKYGWHVMRVLEQFVEYYAGPEAHDALNTFNASWADNEAVTQAFEKYKEFSDLGYFPEGFVTNDPNDSRLQLYSGAAAMQLEGQWFDGNIIGDEQDINNYGYFPFPSSDTAGEGRMSAFAEMFQINANVSEAELDAAIRFMDFYMSDAVVDEYTHQFNMPLPLVGAEIPEGMPNVAQMVADMDTRGIFTITDQAFPPEVADVLFAAQDAVATGTMAPEEAGASLQAGIDSYIAANS